EHGGVDRVRSRCGNDGRRHEHHMWGSSDQVREMAELPTGTVTFLFTDIEGSTQLLRNLGDGYASVWQQHQLIIRDALAAAGGAEGGTEGDSFFAAFSSAPG